MASKAPHANRRRINVNARESMRVLVVEDDDDSREMLLALLACEGFSAAGVATTTEARGLLDSDEFAALIVDHDLPDESGGEFLRRLRESGGLRGVGAVMYSACLAPNVPEGVVVLRKPSDIDRIASEVERAAEHAKRGPTSSGSGQAPRSTRTRRSTDRRSVGAPRIGRPPRRTSQ